MSSSIKQLKVAINGLAADTRYRYEISNKGGNWPVKVSSLSGLILSRSETDKYNISTYVEFCPTTGLCPPGVADNIFYNAPLSDTKAGASVNRSNLYAVIGITLYDDDNNTMVLNTESIAECDDCLPSVELSGDSSVQLDSKTSNSTILSIKADNLIANQKYNYYFDVLDANWPLQLSPLSGTIQTSQDSYHIKSKLRFCAKNDDCENVLDHSMMSNCDPGQAQFAAIKVRLEPDVGNYQSPSDFDLTVSCNDCIEYTLIDIPSSIDLNRVTTNKTSVDIAFKNLIVGKNYRYTINSIDANWPFIVSPNSGTITAFDSEFIVPIKIVACASTGLCSTDRADVLDYSVDLACSSNGPESSRHATLNVSLTPIDSSDDQSDCYTITSNQAVITCDNCIGGPNPALPNIVTTKYQDKYNGNLNIANLIPGQKYDFFLSSTDSNWPTRLYPMSGSFVADTNFFLAGKEFASKIIPFEISFCDSTGLCPPNQPGILPFTLTSESTKKKQFRTSIVANIVPHDCDASASTSNTMILVCDSCASKTSVSLDPEKLNLDENTQNKHSCELILLNLIPNNKYTYAISSIDANWPVLISPISGTISSPTSSTNIPLDIVFCKSTGLCPETNPKVLPYSLDPSCLSQDASTNRYAKFQAILSNIDDPDSDPIISNITSVDCKECLPTVIASLPTGRTIYSNASGIYNGVATLSKLTVGKEYFYNFVSSYSTWPTRFVPESGSFVSRSSDFELPFSVVFSGSDIKNNNRYHTSFKLNINAECLDNTGVNSNSMLLECDGCLSGTSKPELSVSLLSNENEDHLDLTMSSTVDSIDDGSNQGIAKLYLNNFSRSKSYQYKLNSIDANWPVIANPISGIITPTSLYHGYVRLDLSFCYATGICPSDPSIGVIPYSSSKAASCLVSSASVPKYAKFNAEITDPDTNITYTSNAFTIRCKDCLLDPMVAIGGADSRFGYLTLPTTSSQGIGTNGYRGELQISNLFSISTKQIIQYKYNFIIDNNWPVIFYSFLNSSTSGTFKSTDADIDRIEIPYDMRFATLAEINSNVPNILYPKGGFNSNIINPQARIYVVVEGDGCADGESYTSTPLTIRCDKCLPISRIVLPTTQTTLITTNTHTIVPSALNLVSGEKYTYTIENMGSNWPTKIYPMSGTFISDGASTTMPALQLSFCRSTGLCPPNSNNVLPFILDNSCNYIDGNDIRTTIAISVKPTSNPAAQPIVSNTTALVCNNCLPNIKASIPNTISLTSSSTSTTNLTISNTIPGREYSYAAVGLGANWPVVLNPSSGTVVASSTTTTVPVKVSFCRSSGLCPESEPSVLPYTIKSGAFYGNNLDRNARFKFIVSDTDCTSSIDSNDSIVTCENCISGTLISNATSSASLTSVGTTRYQLVTSGQNLVPGESYTYNVNYVDSNWPSLVYPQSGTFIATSTTKTINTDIQFCFPSGGCINHPNSMPYTANGISSNRYVKFNMTIDDPTVPNITTRSEDFTLSCSNCFPPINYGVLMSGAPNLVLPISCCTGTRVMRVDVTGAIPGDIHRYEMTSSVPTINFVPDSGRFIVRPNGSGTFLNMMTSTMPSGTSAIVSCRIVNESSSIESTEFMVVRCSTGC